VKRNKRKIISLDGDSLEIVFIFNEELRKHFGEYPDFSEVPRYTPMGRPWVNVTNEDCPFSEGEYGDCGSCPYLLKQSTKDLIGVCTHEKKRKDKNEMTLMLREENIVWKRLRLIKSEKF